MGKYERKEKLMVRVLDLREKEVHSHQDIELIYILDGEMDMEVEGRAVHLGLDDVFVVNANKKHGYRASERILFAQLSIEYQLVSDILNSMDIIFLCDSTRGNNERYDALKKLLKQLLDHYLSSRRGVANFGHIALCYQIMDLLSVHFLVQMADRDSWGEKEKRDDRINQIENYIHANYNQAISMKELSEKLYLSSGYLSRFFKKTYGCTFADYLTNIRLHHAVEELINTDMPITRIAYDNGFANVTVFNKAFKKQQGESPSELRNRTKKQMDSAESKENEARIDARLDQYLKDGGAQEDTEEDTSFVNAESSVQDFEKVAIKKCNTVNIGEAADLLRSEVQEHVVLLKALGVVYVRFWNVFTQDLLIDVYREDQNYNFARLDSILDFLLGQGMKPHIELGMKPKRLMRNVQSPLFERQEKTETLDSVRWEKVMKAMLNHLARRYGGSELDTWRIELWLDEKKWNQKNADLEYFQLFDKLYGTVRQYSARMEVGGCGIRANTNRQTAKDFLSRWTQQAYQPDYLSVIFYAYQKGEEDYNKYLKRDSDQEAFLRSIRDVKSIMDAVGMGGMRLYVTEWNLTVSDRNYMNDSCFMGAYIVKNILDVYESVDVLAFYQGSDRVSEYYDSNLLLYGGRGLLSKNSMMKPSAFAFEFLNNLYPYFVGKGANYLVTTDGQESFGIICHNQKPLNYNYYLTPENEIRKENLWRYYENREEVRLRLDLVNMKDGMYKIKRYCLDESNGSILNIWSEMNYEEELSRNDIAYFRKVCEPKLIIQKYRVEKGRMHLDLSMPPNQIMFIRIRRFV